VTDVSDVSDAVSDGHEEKRSELNLVSDVTDVTDLAGGGETKCAHCGKVGDLQQVYYGTDEALLHHDCRQAWLAARDDLSIPSYLDRRGELSS
jgi:hypothetical protein